MNFSGIVADSANESGQRPMSFSDHGSLEDLLAHEDPGSEIYSVAVFLMRIDPSFRVIHGLQVPIIHSTTGMIIHYRDFFKLDNPMAEIPYVFYRPQADGNEIGLLVFPWRRSEYLYAKGTYYCMTEKGSAMDDMMNHTLVVLLDPAHRDETRDAIKKAAAGEETFGKLQRSLDRLYVRRLDDLLQLSIRESNQLFQDAFTRIKQGEDRETVIRQSVTGCYLLKKNLYVSVMKNKRIQQNHCNGDIRQQRLIAKQYANQVPFVPYAEIWKYNPEDEPVLGQWSDEEIKTAG